MRCDLAEDAEFNLNEGIRNRKVAAEIYSAWSKFQVIARTETSRNILAAE